MKHMNVSAPQFHPALGDSGAELEVYCRERTGLLADDGARWGVLIFPGGGYVRIAPAERRAGGAGVFGGGCPGICAFI